MGDRGLAALCLVYGVVIGALLYRRWAALEGRVGALERHVLELRFPMRPAHGIDLAAENGSSPARKSAKRTPAAPAGAEVVGGL